MKRIVLKRVLAVAIGLLLCFIVFKISIILYRKSQITQEVRTIPAFSLKTLQGDMFTREQIPLDKKVVFIYFNTECEYCYYEAQDIGEHIEEFSKAFLIFVSPQERGAVKSFAREQGLLGYDNVIFLQDEYQMLARQWGVRTTPYLFVYDQQGELLLRHQGQMKTEKIISILKGN